MRKTIIAALLAVGVVPAAALAGPRDHDHHHHGRYDGGRGGSRWEEREDRGGRHRHGYDRGWYGWDRYRGRYVRRDCDHSVHYHTYRHAVRHKDHYHIHEHVRPHVHHHHD